MRYTLACRVVSGIMGSEYYFHICRMVTYLLQTRQRDERSTLSQQPGITNVGVQVRRDFIWRANPQAFNASGETTAECCRATGSSTLERVTRLRLLWAGADARHSARLRRLRDKTWVNISLQNITKIHNNTRKKEARSRCHFWQKKHQISWQSRQVCNAAMHRLCLLDTFKVQNTL